MNEELAGLMERCRTMETMVKLAEVKLKSAAQERDEARVEQARAVEEFTEAFFRAGGVSVVIRDDGYRNHIDSVAARNLFVTKHAMLASGRVHALPELEIPIEASRARTMRGLYESFQSAKAQAIITGFVRLVEKLIEEKELSAEDRLVIVDNRYFIKEGDGWVCVRPIQAD